MLDDAVKLFPCRTEEKKEYGREDKAAVSAPSDKKAPTGRKKVSGSKQYQMDLVSNTCISKGCK